MRRGLVPRKGPSTVTMGDHMLYGSKRRGRYERNRNQGKPQTSTSHCLLARPALVRCIAAPTVDPFIRCSPPVAICAHTNFWFTLRDDPMSTGTSESATSIAKAAKAAFEASQLIASSERVRALHELREELVSAKADVLAANRRDLEVHLAPIPSYM